MQQEEYQISENVKYYQWNETMTESAKQIINKDETTLPEDKVTKLENYQRLHWDVFYKNNKDHFYKDRHYLRHEFIELIEACSESITSSQ